MKTHQDMPAELFQGFDTFAGLARSTAVQGKWKPSNGSARCDYTLCETTESLYQALDVSVTAAANFGVDSVDAKSEFAKSLKTTSSSIAIVMYASSTEGSLKQTSAELGTGVTPPEDGDVLAFYNYYGDSFVSEITQGAEYIASYVFYCQTIEDQTRVKAALALKGITEGGELSADLQTSIEEVQKQETVRTSFKQHLSGFSHQPFPDRAGLIRFALDFPTKHADAPVTIKFEATGYEHVPGMKPDVWKAIRENRDLFKDTTLGHESITMQAEALTTLHNQVQWLRGIYDAYDFQADSTLEKRSEQLKQDMDDLGQAIRELRYDPTKPFIPLKPESRTWGQPALSFDGPHPDGRWGGGGGDEFSDVNRQSILSGHILQKVRLWGGNRVDRVASTFSDTRDPVTRGGDGGTPSPELVLGAGEYVTEISGRSGSRLDHLTMVSSLGQQTAAGGDGGAEFSWQVPQGSVFVGFAGRAGWGIDALSPLICTFKPAVWEDTPSH